MLPERELLRFWNPVGPDERSLLRLFTEFQDSFSSPSSHGRPAGLHNCAASGHAGHAPHSDSGEGEADSTRRICVTLSHVLASSGGGLPLDPSSYQAFIAVFVFFLGFCSPGGSGLTLKSQTSGTTASMIT